MLQITSSVPEQDSQCIKGISSFSTFKVNITHRPLFYKGRSWSSLLFTDSINFTQKGELLFPERRDKFYGSSKNTQWRVWGAT